MVTKRTRWPQEHGLLVTPTFFWVKIHVWYTKGVFVPNLRKIHGVEIAQSHYLKDVRKNILQSRHFTLPWNIEILNIEHLNASGVTVRNGRSCGQVDKALKGWVKRTTVATAGRAVDLFACTILRRSLFAWFLIRSAYTGMCIKLFISYKQHSTSSCCENSMRMS